jgi:predicted metalloprotease
LPARFISSTTRHVGIITGEYKVRVPDSLTHASSANRVPALKRGLETGDVSACGLGR